MKKILLLLLVIGIGCNSNRYDEIAEDPTSYYIKEFNAIDADLKGPIKKVVEDERIEEFDKNGNNIFYLSKNLKVHREYDGSGRLLTSTGCFLYNGGCGDIRISKNEYEDGKLIKHIDNTNNPHKYISFIYDSKGRLYQSDHVDNEINTKEFYSYDKNDRIIEIYEIDKESNLIMKKNFIFNNRKLIRTETIENDRKTIDYYNKNGKVIKSDIFDLEGNSIEVYQAKYSRTELTYKKVNNLNNTISEGIKNLVTGDSYSTTQLTKGTLINKYKKEYNKNGDLIFDYSFQNFEDTPGQIKMHLSSGEKFLEETRKIAYKYDKHNNWIEKITTVIIKGDSKIYTDTRNLEYYE